MGKIRKIASQKHEATISPFIAEQVKVIQEVPIYQLPATLASFPRPWPFPRGDLYHWIPVLNRFDDILHGFNIAYELNDGPQTVSFSRKYTLKGEKDADATEDNVLDEMGMPDDADRVLVESVLEYTLLLYENCANRSLYASSAHLNDLLNTTSLSLLTLVLRLAFRLAQRYTQERLRISGGGHLQPINPTILAQHYQFDLEKLEKLALPFVKSLHPAAGEAATIKNNEKGTSVTPIYAPSLLSLAQDFGSGPEKWHEYGSAWLNYLSEGSASIADSPPASPSPSQRPSAHTARVDSRSGLKLLEIASDELAKTDITSILKHHLPFLPKSAHYEFLCRLRTASALASSVQTRHEIVSIRILAIGNLASVYPESQLQSKIFQHEMDEARRSHIPHQLCDLLHPPGKDSSAIPRPLQTMAMRALESFANHRLRSHEVLHAIGYNVNHGVLTYLVRKAVTDLSNGDSEPETVEEADWFAALFDLLHCLPRSVHRLGDALSSTGLLDSFVQALKLRTYKADQERHRFLTLLDIFVYNSRETFTALVNSGGLDAYSELMEREVHSALKATHEGNGLPAEWKTPMTFSKINFMQQQTLRNLFKVLKNMISQNNGPFDRVLRNLIESSQLLGALKQVMEHPTIYGSNVWCGAVEIFTNFIHNEPTSYAAIAEAGLAKAVLDTVLLPTDAASGKYGVLPTSEAVLNIPLAFGAMCLNENGMKVFQESGALDRFFDILLGFAQTKSLANSLSEAESWGGAFDELARHHANLKPEIMQKIVNLTVNLRDFIAKQKFYGSLQVVNVAGKVTTEVPTEDLTMKDGSSLMDSVPATPLDTINVISGFLNGVFRTSALCTSFCELGGIQAMVDVAATAVLHSDQVLQFCQGPITKTIQILIHQKPHLTLPLLMNRLREALSSVSPFIETGNDAAVFSPYISGANLKARDRGDSSGNGSAVLADLLIVRNLTHMLTRSFAENSHRNSHPVSQVNLSDLYIELVGILGRLQSRCMVEYMLLQDMASAQDAGSKVSGSALDAAQDYRATFMSKSDQVQQPGVPPEESVNLAAVPSTADDPSQASSEEARGIAKQNFKIICSVISRIPTDVAWFFSAVGKAILLRRLTSDAYNKQCVLAVATSIAKAVVSVLDCPLPEDMSPKLVDYYHRSSITCTSIAMIEKTRESGMQPLTLILWKFKQSAGYESLTRIGHVLLAHAQLPSYSDTEESRSRGPTWAIEGLRNLTVFLGRSTSNKDIADAPQTLALMSSTRDSQRNSLDNFSTGQFLIELRAHVLRFILPIWTSDAIARMHVEFVKAVCSILQLILNAENEGGVLTRQDQPLVQPARPHRTMNVASSDNLNHLTRNFDQQLAEEALFRCNNQRNPAQEYCELRQRHYSVQRFPIPEQDLPGQSERHSGTSGHDGEIGHAQESTSVDSDAQEMLRRVVESLPASINQQSEVPQVLPTPNTASVVSKQAELPSLCTIEDLDELRAEVRADLVDRCILVLHTFEKLSFNIADLIMAGAAKSPEPASLRADISATLVQSLVSYAGTNEDLREQQDQFASSAHLLGVILQDKEWFIAAQDFLVEDFDTFSQFLGSISTDQSESLSWLANVLLILEKVLAEEAQPQQIQWIPPNADEAPQETHPNDKIVGLRNPLVGLESKKRLFEHLIALMPRVGKDTTLGTAIIRVLISLTRNRACTELLSGRKNLQRLFMMIKQLSIVSDKKFHGNVMIVLRQIVEDETVIRQVMRNEIQAYFQKQSPRGIDTTIYTRHLFHLVLRDPEAFVEVTNDLVMLARFDRNQQPQPLTLKRNVGIVDNALENKVLTSNGGVDATVTQPSEKSMDDNKPAEVKAPLLERNDGITSFILSELLAYRDVPDSLAPKPQSSGQDDVVMTGAEASTSESNTQIKPSDQNDSKFEASKAGFKAEEHPIFVYRCFLLQTLTELLQSYNCCKLNFINFSRKAEPQTNTPSKPRSGVLYYLLNILIPTGSLQHATDDKSKMSALISYWATHVVVALCTKTNERKENSPATSEEADNVLLHIRRFVLEQILKAYKETNTSDSPEAGLARLLCLADLCNKMLAGKPNSSSSRLGRLGDNPDDYVPTQKQIARIMFEKNYIPALTSSLGDIDASIPGANRAVKHILAPLKLLTHTAIELSMSGEASSSSEPGLSTDEDEEVSSATSASDRAGGREETPDLFRNSTLGMFEPGREDNLSSGSSSEEDEEDVYGDAYADDMEYDMDDGEEIQAPGPDDDAVSDDDMDGMGPVEGIDGDVPMDMEIELEDENVDDDQEDDSMDEDVSEDDDEEDDDEEDDEDEEAEIIEEISDDDENASLAEDETAGDWHADENAGFGVDGGDQDRLVVLDEDGNLGDPDDHSEYDGDHLDVVETVAGGMPFREGDDIVASDEDGLPHAHDDDEASEDDEEEDDDEDDDMDDDDQVYESLGDYEEDEAETQPFAWGWPHGPGRRQLHRHIHHMPFIGTASQDRERLFMPGFRNYRNSGQSRANDEDANPLLNRQRRPNDSSHGATVPYRSRLGTSFGIGQDPQGQSLLNRLEREILHGSGVDISNTLLNLMHTHGHGLQVTMRQLPGGMGNGDDAREYVVEPNVVSSLHSSRHHDTTPARREPASAVDFEPASTETRWQESARILFGPQSVEKSGQIVNALLKLLVPPAIKRDQELRRKQEEEEKKREERRAKERAEREEREARERREEEERRAKEAEDQAKAEAEAAEAAAAEEAHVGPTAASGVQGDAMDISEGTTSAPQATMPEAQQDQSRPRVLTQIRGREVDITELGIDPSYIEALPEDVREEVIMQQYSAQRSTAAATGEEPTQISEEFLAALPPEIRAELLQQEASERRRLEREEQRRRQQAEGSGVPQPEDIDTASFIASLDPILRREVLTDGSEDLINALPPDLAAEARALGGNRSRNRLPSYLGSAEPPSYLLGGSASRGRHQNERDGQPKPGDDKPQRRPIVQMIDKSGIATLLRLMFLTIPSTSKWNLNAILTNACGNRQTRAEVVNGLLSILQDGSADSSAIERCFSQLTARAKQAISASKTPQSSKKQASPAIHVAADATPHLVIGQCISALLVLANGITTVPQFFLTEHDIIGTFKSKSGKKGKARESRSSRYPLMALLALLERDTVLANSSNMEQLSELLAVVTRPLADLSKKSDEDATTNGKTQSEVSNTLNASAQSIAPEDLPAEAADASVNSAAPVGSETTAQQKEAEPKKHRSLVAPDIPAESLKPVVNILLARECSSQTFRNTITMGTNLSAIPNAKDVFKDELMKHARILGTTIQGSLSHLIEQLGTVETDMQAQSVAMADFSPNGSDQTKLSRIITALDYFYDPETHTADGKEKQPGLAEKSNDLLRLFEDKTFTELWSLLSRALDATKRSETDYFFNVATILLPLVEALLVVCKRVPLKEKKSSGPGVAMRNIFFAFTNSHKKVLNDLVRQNPKLMNANFSVLIKNSGVLEFDNKRSYFSRRLHHRTGDMRQYPHQTLQLNVRREQVFLDSYKGLHYKTPQEIKYGKLNIRFHNEEGVDAGGVTREWFQVLARQMFNPDYALFNPVASDRTTFHPNSLSAINPEHLHFFKFIGRIIGKALYENRVLDCHFSRAVYKKILGQPVTMKDMETVDLDYSKNISWMLNNNITDILTETFSISQDTFGVEEVIDLIPDGHNVPVTEENKHDFVRRVIEYRLTGSVQEQLDSFLTGFYDIVPLDLISIFDEGELELLISGMPDIDVDDWKANTDYHNYNASSPQIQWFWRAVRSFDKEEQAKLLQFVTGTGKVPLNGFKELEGMNGFTRFSVHKDFSSKDRLPSSHTCFNQLDLPEYDSYESLRKNLYTAMTTGNEYFGYA